MPHQKKKWVIVFLIYADFRTDNAFSMEESMKIEINSLLEDILTTPMDHETARLFVILNSIRLTSGTSTGMLRPKKWPSF